MLINHPPRALSFPNFTWASRPPATSTGQIIQISDFDNTLFVSTGTRWKPVNNDFVLARGASPGMSVTGTTTETALASVLVPGGLLGPNGELRIEAWFSVTNNANIKQMRYRFGGMVGATVLSRSAANFSIHSQLAVFANRGSEDSQAGWGPVHAPYVDTTSTISTFSLDTAVDRTLFITGALFVGTDVLTLERYVVKVLVG